MKLDKELLNSILILVIVAVLALPVYHFAFSDDGLEPVTEEEEPALNEPDDSDSTDNVNTNAWSLDEILDLLQSKSEEQGLEQQEDPLPEGENDLIEIIENGLSEIEEIIKSDEVEDEAGEEIEEREEEEVEEVVENKVILPEFIMYREMTMEEICQKFNVNSVPVAYFSRYLDNCVWGGVASEYSTDINTFDGSILNNDNYLLWRRQQ